ncbi:MAG: fibrobacter succinogenes major paralogous domain-containing protein [Fibrobacter sp.]|nr:fibrobacter succinogenes major paralogous domain-containing protein [Fibrobacter sp.]
MKVVPIWGEFQIQISLPVLALGKKDIFEYMRFLINKIGIFLMAGIFCSCSVGDKDSFDGVKSVKIGGKRWMSENVQVNGNTRFTLEEAKGLCPAGWRLATIAEWQKLVKDVGGVMNLLDKSTPFASPEEVKELQEIYGDEKPSQPPQDPFGFSLKYVSDDDFPINEGLCGDGPGDYVYGEAVFWTADYVELDSVWFEPVSPAIKVQFVSFDGSGMNDPMDKVCTASNATSIKSGYVRCVKDIK